MLARSRFQPVHVPEPTVDETYEIMLGLRERYEAHHKLRYTDEALKAAAKFSSQYISGEAQSGWAPPAIQQPCALRDPSLLLAPSVCARLAHAG